jgi:hypothetical protein
MVLATALCLSSCTTAPPNPEPPKSLTKNSPAEERYKKTVEDQLGPLWYRLAEAHVDSLQLGTVETTFEILAAGGAARNLRIKSNTGGRIDELVARRAIEQLRAPPVPPAVLAHHDHITFEELFTMYQNDDRKLSPTPQKKR